MCFENKSYDILCSESMMLPCELELPNMKTISSRRLICTYPAYSNPGRFRRHLHRLKLPQVPMYL